MHQAGFNYDVCIREVSSQSRNRIRRATFAREFEIPRRSIYELQVGKFGPFKDRDWHTGSEMHFLIIDRLPLPPRRAKGAREYARKPWFHS